MKRSVFLMLLALVALPCVARANVRLDGTWPDQDKTVALDLDGVPRAQALKRLASGAGWSIVITEPPGDSVDIHVKGQPARKVLQILLADGSYIATRDGDLVSIRREPAAPPRAADGAAAPVDAAPVTATEAPTPTPTVASATPSPSASSPTAPSGKHAEDRIITGGNLRIEKNETVHDVTLFGGTVEVLGTVTGDLSVFGGKLRIASGAHVFGDASVLGGLLTVEDGARVDGDVDVIGGSLERGEHSEIGGNVAKLGDDDDNDHSHASSHPKESRSAFGGFAHEVGGGVTWIALLFVFGAVLLALASRRLEDLRVEVAARPMRSFALGVVGSVAAIALVIALCVTIIGIPVAIVGVLAGAIGVYVGIAAVLTTAGEALLRHRTQNPYVHLAVGCVLFLVIGSLPLVGWLVKAVVVLCGVGVLVATRGAGLVTPRRGRDAGPWSPTRTA